MTTSLELAYWNRACQNNNSTTDCSNWCDNPRTQIVGVVGDIRRDMEGHHYAEKCSVFGINATELAALQR